MRHDDSDGVEDVVDAGGRFVAATQGTESSCRYAEEHASVSKGP